MALFKKDNSWYIDYYVEGGRKREAIGPNKKMAEHALAKRKLQIAENRYLDIAKMSKVTFEQLSRNYLQYAKADKLSWGRDERSIRLLSKKFAGMKLSLITPLAIEEYKNERRQSVAPATVNRELACLKHMFTKAIHWDMTSINPVKLVKLFREDNARTRYLSLDEIDKLLSSISERVKPMVITALNTGMRLGEILKLKWEDVDLINRVIIVRRSKNGYSRDIPVTDQLYQALKPIDQSKEYVFSNADGNPVKSIRTAFEKAVLLAGLKDFTFHDLRHTFASHLVMNGTDLLTVKELLGHRTINMTVRYSHLSQSHKRGAVDTLRFPDRHYLDTKANDQKKAKIVSSSPVMT